MLLVFAEETSHLFRVRLGGNSVVLIFFSVPSNPCVAVRICTGGDWYSSGLRMRTV